MTRIITNDYIKAAARAAIENGTLLATSPGWDGRCYYHCVCDDGRERYCGIGAALTPAEHDEIESREANDATVYQLGEARPGETPPFSFTFEDPKFAQRLQRAHDNADNDGGKAFRELIA